MMQKPTLKTTWIPLALAITVLIILNIGLYFQLGVQPSLNNLEQNLTIPYSQPFVEGDVVSIYSVFGGDWEIRDETLVQLSTTGYDLGGFIPIQIPSDQPYEYETRLRFLGGSMGGGILFNSQSINTRQKSHMARMNVDAGQLWLIYGYFGDDSNFTGQGSTLVPFAPDNTDWHTVGVQVFATTYNLLVDGQIIAENIPLVYFGGAVGLISSTSQIAFDDLRVDVLADTNIVQTTPEATDVMPIATSITTPIEAGVLLWDDTFDGSGVGDTAWIPLSGDWQFTDVGLRQIIRDGYDFSIINNQLVSAPYRFIAQFRHDEGIGGGVIFNLPQTTSRNGGYMVRYIEENTLTWGYFDDAGAYIGVGSATVSPPATDNHILEVIVNDGSYTLILDGTMIAESIPTTTINGYIGLTNSQSIVTFTGVQVLASQGIAQPQITATPDFGSTALDLNTITGQWETSGYTTIQTATDPIDYIAGMGVFAETFRVSVDITLPSDADITDAGGGLIFHMNGRDDAALGYMVRFANGGNDIFWGVYDENAVFTGQGGAPLNLEKGVLHTLTIIVRQGNYDILVDGVTVIQNLPLERGDGWIGLISFRGPVTFANLRLSIGENAP